MIGFVQPILLETFMQSREDYTQWVPVTTAGWALDHNAYWSDYGIIDNNIIMT